MPLRLPKIAPSEITPPQVYFNRRAFLTGAVAAAGGAALGRARAAVLPAQAGAALSYTLDRAHSVDALVHAAGQDETPNTWQQITNYNNYYEFGVGKTDPAEYAGQLQTRPWSVAIEGEAEVTGSFPLEEILKPYALEERIYRMRCVEAWSMVIPWVGFPLAAMLKRFKPTSKAKYVAFETLYRPSQMPGQREGILPSVPHPRWSQATERRIGAPLFHERQPTLMFNGYADEVAYLYRGMDLRKYF